MNESLRTSCVTFGVDPGKTAVYQASPLGTRLMVGYRTYRKTRRNPQISAVQVPQAPLTYAHISPNCGTICVTFLGRLTTVYAKHHPDYQAGAVNAFNRRNG